jgi:hypothetical protein
MKRYMLFWGDNYYPNGGMDDFIGDYDTMDEAMQVFDSKVKEEIDNSYYENKEQVMTYRWAMIYDLEKREKVWSTQ